MKHILFLLCLCYSLTSIAQNISYDATIETGGYVSSTNELPLWMYTNQLRAIGNSSDFTTTASVAFSYKIDETNRLILGGSSYFRNNLPNEFQRKYFFLEYTNNWFSVVVGAKQRTEVAQGLSSTNQNFLWSRNARPLGGLSLATSRPISLGDIFSINAAMAHYQLNDERFVENTRIHYKHLTVFAEWNNKNKITFKLQHTAQWAGVSPVFGTLPNDFKAYIDVFFAREATESGEVGEGLNAVGNHLGTYLLDYQLRLNSDTISFYHEHPFEDGSGTRLANFPDGVWGVYASLSKNKWITGLLYEFISTKDQSGSSGVGQDNYFANRIYRTGYSYEGAIIGFPLILNSSEVAVNENTIGIIGNRVSVHHIGIAGRIDSLQWKLKSTFSKNFGRFSSPFVPPLVTTHNYIEILYNTAKFGSFTIRLGMDTSNQNSTIYGSGFQYMYRF